MKNLSSQTNYPFIVSVISTKGGVTKSTNVANCNGLTNCNKPKTVFDKLSQNGELQNG